MINPRGMYGLPYKIDFPGQVCIEKRWLPRFSFLGYIYLAYL